MGAYTLLQDLTVASNSTSVVLNNFGTITKDDFIKVVMNIVNVSSSANTIGFFPNGQTTTTNYHRQLIRANGTSVLAERVNQNRFGLIGPNLTGTIYGYAKLSENNNINTFGNYTSRDDSLLETVFSYTTSSNVTFSSGYTSVTIGGNQTNGIGTGSRIQIYRLDAVKEADITVTSNTTQVDILNLSIDKDSEYLLVSDIVGGGNVDYRFHVNNDMTITNYHSQRIRGQNTTASAGRVNFPRFAASETGRSLVYSHIKLSNIGAYTSQSYSMPDTNDPTGNFRVENMFVSSTAENITSITQLNIRSNLANGIGSGTRFHLYKLYE